MSLAFLIQRIPLQIPSCDLPYELVPQMDGQPFCVGLPGIPDDALHLCISGVLIIALNLHMRLFLAGQALQELWHGLGHVLD
jgi:hypothetical protein